MRTGCFEIRDAGDEGANLIPVKSIVAVIVLVFLGGVGSVGDVGDGGVGAVRDVVVVDGVADFIKVIDDVTDLGEHGVIDENADGLGGGDPRLGDLAVAVVGISAHRDHVPDEPDSWLVGRHQLAAAVDVDGRMLRVDGEDGVDLGGEQVG